MNEFGAVLYRLKEAKKLSFRKMAKKMGYTGSYITQMCLGQREIPTDFVHKVMAKTSFFTGDEISELWQAAKASKTRLTLDLTKLTEQERKYLFELYERDTK